MCVFSDLFQFHSSNKNSSKRTSIFGLIFSFDSQNKPTSCPCLFFFKKDALFTNIDPSRPTPTCDDSFLKFPKVESSKEFFMPFVEFDKAIENTTEV